MSHGGNLWTWKVTGVYLKVAGCIDNRKNCTGVDFHRKVFSSSDIVEILRYFLEP